MRLISGSDASRRPQHLFLQLPPQPPPRGVQVAVDVPLQYLREPRKLHRRRDELQRQALLELPCETRLHGRDPVRSNHEVRQEAEAVCRELDPPYIAIA